MDRVLGPCRGEYLAQIRAKVIVSHPPVAIAVEYVIQLFFQTFVVVPSFVLVGELTSPLALAPGISDSDQLEAIHLADLENSVCVVEQDT